MGQDADGEMSTGTGWLLKKSWGLGQFVLPCWCLVESQEWHLVCKKPCSINPQLFFRGPSLNMAQFVERWAN